MKYFFGLSALVICVLLSCKNSQASLISKTGSQKKPNIIFILADDLGWADLPMYGNTFNEAPNLQKLANEGVQFLNAYAANPVCSPTRASIQTGQYPARIGINDFLPGHWRPYEKVKVPINKTQYLPLEYQTIGEILQNTGYKTGYFGKWHLGHTQKHFPKNQGYDKSVVYNGGGFFNYNDIMSPKTDFKEGTVLSSALTDLSLDFIEDNKDEPFFLFLAHYDVHVQLDAHNELIEKFLKKPKSEDYPSNAIYAAMIENIDNSLGRIMVQLETLEIEDNTIIVFFSDNGGLVKRYDKRPLIDNRSQDYYKNDSLQYIASSNKPLRGEKGTLYEGGIRVPLLVKWPGKVIPNTKSTALVSSIDFFPSILEMVGDSLFKKEKVDGKSIVPELKGKKRDDRVLFWHYPVYHHDVPASAIRKGNWKLIHFLDDDHKELYNLKNDIGEENNLAFENPQITTELLKKLQDWREEIDAAMPETNPDFEEEKRKDWGKHPGFNAMLTGNK